MSRKQIEASRLTRNRSSCMLEGWLFFFSSGMADDALRLCPLHENKHSTKTFSKTFSKTLKHGHTWSHVKGKSTTTEKQTKNTTTTTRKSPSQICVSPEKQQTRQATGPEPKKANNHRRDLPYDTAVDYHCAILQKHAIEN